MTPRQQARARDRAARFELAKSKGYAGFYTCSKCGSFGFAAAMRRESVKCRSCSGAAANQECAA